MSSVTELHNEAMDIAESAFFHQRKGENETAQKLFIDALKLEQQAASLLEAMPENEPSRSILYRSAASLAFNSKDFGTAEKLVAQGLLGTPPVEIRDELRDIFDEVTFERHLSARGMELSESELKMTLTGGAISKGIVHVDHLLTRLEKLSILVRRTVERSLHLPFQINRPPHEERNNRFGLFQEAVLQSSFAIKLRLGKPDQQLPLLSTDLDPQEIVDELLRCMEDVQNDNILTLKERIGDEDYFQNFIGIAKQIAPDGKDITTVGFTAVRGGIDKPVGLRKTRQDIKSSVNKAFPLVEKELESRTLEGVLAYANTPRTNKFGRVRLRQEGEKREVEILVPIGLMKDVVQPYYDEIVSISVFVDKGKYYLDDIIR